MSIRIIKQGIADSIQDLGRPGYQQSGINPGGAMDNAAARVANMLVGNEPGDAVIELHFPASVILFEDEALIALSGGDFNAMINDKAIPLNTPVIIEKNCLLQFEKMISGTRCYLAVRSGFKISKWLNSYSTHIKAEAGGFKGRFLQKQDQLFFHSHEKYPAVAGSDSVTLPWKADVNMIYPEGPLIRIVKGKEYDWLEERSQQLMEADSFTITAQSDRMGYRMKGDSLQTKIQQELISTGVTKGTIQLLPDGQIIILMADHQTTGGYPRIAHVIAADIPKLAQMRPNGSTRFQMITHEEAEDLYYKQDQHLHQLQNACIFRLEAYLQKN